MNIRQTEFQIMNILWSQGEMTASNLCRILQNKVSWKRSTFYTVLKKCIEKGFVERIGTDFTCRPVISLEEVQKAKLTELIHLFFEDSEQCLIDMILKKETV